MISESDFLTRVNKNGPIQKPNSDGYGKIKIRQKTCIAHRVSYLIFVGEITNNLCVLHRCDNRMCVNPDHLFLGTPLDNTRDMDDKGRRKILYGDDNGARKHPERIPRGESHWTAKKPENIVGGTRHYLAVFSRQQISLIRKDRVKGMKLRELVAKYGSSLCTISRIINHHSYKKEN